MPKDGVHPVTDEEHIAGNVVPGKTLIRHGMREHDAQGNHDKVERPDTQDTPDVKQPERDSSGLPAFPQQERGDKKSAQREK